MSNILIYSPPEVESVWLRLKLNEITVVGTIITEFHNERKLIKEIVKQKSHIVLYILTGGELNIPKLLAPVTTTGVELLCVVPCKDDLIKSMIMYHYNYITVPVNVEELKEKIEKVAENRKRFYSREGNLPSKEDLQKTGIDDESIEFPINHGVEYVRANCIVSCFATRKKTILICIDKEPLLVNLSFHETMELVRGYDIIQANRGEAINFKHVIKKFTGYGGMFMLINESEVYLGEEYEENILGLFEIYRNRQHK